jgi:hypothetical protein
LKIANSIDAAARERFYWLTKRGLLVSKKKPLAGRGMIQERGEVLS